LNPYSSNSSTVATNSDAPSLSTKVKAALLISAIVQFIAVIGEFGKYTQLISNGSISVVSGILTLISLVLLYVGLAKLLWRGSASRRLFFISGVGHLLAWYALAPPVYYLQFMEPHIFIWHQFFPFVFGAIIAFVAGWLSYRHYP
jgi:hypothetical protein